MAAHEVSHDRVLCECGGCHVPAGGHARGPGTDATVRIRLGAIAEICTELADT